MTKADPARPSPATFEEMAAEAAVEAVRQASRQGRLMDVDELCAAVAAGVKSPENKAVREQAEETAQETADDPAGDPADERADERATVLPGLLPALLAARPDIAALQSVSGRTLYHAPELLSRTYARILDRQGSPVLLMAEEIRANSRDYPRPVPVALFEQPPFGLGPEDIALALRTMAESPEHQDISSLTADGGETYLFSTRHLERGYALFLAQRAESLSDNP